jgi:two-component system, LytTR family, sensor kinase
MDTVKNSFSSIRWHLLFWSIYFLYTWLPEASIHDNYGALLLNACVLVPIAIITTYYSIFITIEKFWLKKQYGLFWLSLFFSLTASGIVRRFFLFKVMYPILYPERLNEPLFYLPKIMMGAVQVHLVTGVGVMIYLLAKWKKHQHLTEVLLKEKVAAELQLLKSQVQPHFIFNTLNNIYMLSLKGSAQTSDMIYRLSALLSYMIYDSKQDTIEFNKELEYIKNYIDLEKIRYGERLDIQLNVFNNTKNIRVPPLLILPLVENAFKHGVSQEVDNSWIHIDITLKKNKLTFKIENSYNEGQIRHSQFGSGLGLVNLRKRLDIFYSNGYELKTMQDESSYLVTLKLDLDAFNYSESLPDTEGVSESYPKTEKSAQKPIAIAASIKALMLL